MALTKRQKIMTGASASIIIFILLGYWLFGASFSSKSGNIYIYIDKDDTRDSVFAKLEDNASPRQMMGVKIVASLLNYGAKHVRTGRYDAGAGISSLQLVRNLRNGRQSAVQLIIPVVHTLDDLAARLASQLQADSAQFAQTFRDEKILSNLGVNTYTAPTLFIPNTYEVYWDITPQALLERMKHECDAYWTDARRAEAKQAGLTPEEVYTLASIVEQESANEAERPMIAGMYLNRLKQGMKLQADPTVKFALNDFALRRIMHAHLTVNSPYNTYQHEGLPIGPICIPSLSAIEAVLHFAHHKYIYMCAKEDFSGTHNFAVTYAEHLQNAKRYADALNRKHIN